MLLQNKHTLLFYINSICGGGAEQVIIQLAKHFADDGFRCVLVTSFVDKTMEYPVPKGVCRRSLEQKQLNYGRVLRNITRIWKLRRIITAEKPAAVIAFMAEPSFRAILATRGLPVKTIVSIRNDPSREYCGKLGRFVAKYIIPHADGIVFQTEDARAWFSQKVQQKSAVILNEVDETFFKASRSTLTQNIVTLGRLSKQKNQKILIEAFAEIADKYPEENLLIYGRGALENELLEIINTLGLNSRAFLMGTTNQVQQVLSQAKLFVLSSDYEGMPNALMEAMAVGVPCISTDCPCGGPRTLIENGANGVLVEVGNKEALAKAMDMILDSENFGKPLGENARQSSVRFKPDAVFFEWKSYIERIIKD